VIVSRIGAIILAAGESKRLGQPKQLVRFRGKTLVENAYETAASVCAHVAVVLGANADLVRPTIPKGAIVVQNENWAEGVASSIHAGLKVIENESNLVILMSCDQPLVSPALLLRLLSAPGITAAEYEGTLGIPAMFSRMYFPLLYALNGTEGAKKVLLKYQPEVKRFPAPEAAFDVDTPADVQRLQTFE
jgi:molybdenum cofactor cytidylyltransferase